MSEKATCQLCQGRDLEHIAGKIRFGYEADVYHCRQCNMVFLDQESFAYPPDFYEKEYHQTYITHVEPSAFDPDAYFQKMLKANKIWADRFSLMLTGKEKVLDVGCSTGHFLELIKDKAGSVHGHDLNQKEVSFCQEKLCLDVSDKPLTERFEPGTFDYITMIYVLEHIAQPVDFLNYLKPFLKPDGKFVILVPNAKDALVNLYDIPEFRSFYYCIEHLFYYTPATVKVVFDRAGLSGSIETLQEYPLANHLNWGFRRKPADSLAARSGLPDIPLRDPEIQPAWQTLWGRLNEVYQEFLRDNGFGDRIWAVVGRSE